MHKDKNTYPVSAPGPKPPPCIALPTWNKNKSNHRLLIQYSAFLLSRGCALAITFITKTVVISRQQPKVLMEQKSSLQLLHMCVALEIKFYGTSQERSIKEARNNFVCCNWSEKREWSMFMRTRQRNKSSMQIKRGPGNLPLWNCWLRTLHLESQKFSDALSPY